jgi:hypothetical protein
MKDFRDGSKRKSAARRLQQARDENEAWPGGNRVW